MARNAENEVPAFCRKQGGTAEEISSLTKFFVRDFLCRKEENDERAT